MTLRELPHAFFEAKANEYPTGSAPHDIASALSLGGLLPSEREDILDSYGLAADQSLRALFLDWVLDYVRFALAGQPLASDVADAVEPVKQALGIQEGDFLRLRPAEVKALLAEQLEQILEDGILDQHEELAQAALQRAFDLGYDQYLAFTRPQYELALQEMEATLSGADPTELSQLERRLLSLRAICELAVTQPRSLGGLR